MQDDRLKEDDSYLDRDGSKRKDAARRKVCRDIHCVVHNVTIFVQEPVKVKCVVVTDQLKFGDSEV